MTDGHCPRLAAAAYRQTERLGILTRAATAFDRLDKALVYSHGRIDSKPARTALAELNAAVADLDAHDADGVS